MMDIEEIAERDRPPMIKLAESHELPRRIYD
jgi:hypothetical protein